MNLKTKAIVEDGRTGGGSYDLVDNRTGRTVGRIDITGPLPGNPQFLVFDLYDSTNRKIGDGRMDLRLSDQDSDTDC